MLLSLSFSLLCTQGYKQQKAFIITQGPMDTTTKDFWKMVYDRKCGAIVMLSKLSEVSYCDTQTHRDTQTMALITCCSMYLVP